jgi:hypothetical protein
MTPCSLLGDYQRVGGTSCPYFQHKEVSFMKQESLYSSETLVSTYQNARNSLLLLFSA